MIEALRTKLNDCGRDMLSHRFLNIVLDFSVRFLNYLSFENNHRRTSVVSFVSWVIHQAQSNEKRRIDEAGPAADTGAPVYSGTE